MTDGIHDLDRSNDTRGHHCYGTPPLCPTSENAVLKSVRPTTSYDGVLGHRA
jgi:hypothetical protein